MILITWLINNPLILLYINLYEFELELSIIDLIRVQIDFEDQIKSIPMY